MDDGSGSPDPRNWVAKWIRDEHFWREVVANTCSALVAALILAVVALIARPESEQLRRFLVLSIVALPAVVFCLALLALIWFIVRPSSTEVYVYRDARIRYGRWWKRHKVRFDYPGWFDKPDRGHLEDWLRVRIRDKMPRPFTRWRPIMRPGMFAPTFNEPVFIQLPDEMRPQFTVDEWGLPTN